MRLHNYFQLQQKALREAGQTSCPVLRVTPGMFAELQRERPQPDPTNFHVHTCQGSHRVEVIDEHTRATGTNVILAPREDIFHEVDNGTQIQMVCLSNEVTSTPDHVACCEVISVGELVDNVKPGDLAFIDFYDVKHGYVLENEELYIAGCEAFKALYDIPSGKVVPLANYVLTKFSPERFRVALTGTDRVHIPAYVATDGISGGKTTHGGRALSIVYEDVVAVGPLTGRSLPGCMTRTERAFLDACVAGYKEAADLLAVLKLERERGRHSDIRAGELVAFPKEIAIPIRVRGEQQHLIPYQDVCAVIDDSSILDAAIRRGGAGVLHL